VGGILLASDALNYTFLMWVISNPKASRWRMERQEPEIKIHQGNESQIKYREDDVSFWEHIFN